MIANIPKLMILYDIKTKIILTTQATASHNKTKEFFALCTIEPDEKINLL